MIEIKETDLTLGFASPVFFDRTEKIRERIVDCSREELIDLAFFQLGMLEKFQGWCEKTNIELEGHLGYHEKL
jgi:hypothetical protein